MSQTVLNDYQASWLIQLTSYNFIIQYCQDSLNPVNESSQRLNYIVKLNEECKDSMLEQIENLMSMLIKKYYRDDSILLLNQKVNSSVVNQVQNYHYKSDMSCKSTEVL